MDICSGLWGQIGMNVLLQSSSSTPQAAGHQYWDVTAAARAPYPPTALLPVWVAGAWKGGALTVQPLLSRDDEVPDKGRRLIVPGTGVGDGRREVDFVELLRDIDPASNLRRARRACVVPGEVCTQQESLRGSDADHAR